MMKLLEAFRWSKLKPHYKNVNPLSIKLKTPKSHSFRCFLSIFTSFVIKSVSRTCPKNSFSLPNSNKMKNKKHDGRCKKNFRNKSSQIKSSSGLTFTNRIIIILKFTTRIVLIFFTLADREKHCF